MQVICIDVAEAIARLRAVNAPFMVEDFGIKVVVPDGGRFTRRRLIPWQDSLGSLVSRDAVNAEAIFWQNRNQM